MASFLDNLIIFSKSDSGAVVFSVLFLLVVIALLVGLVFLFRFFVRRFATDNAYFNHQVFLIRLPKEKPQDENKDFLCSRCVRKLPEEKQFLPVSAA